KLNHLYRNDGDGTFTDVTLQAGVGNGLKASFRSMWMDVDLDGWPDLFVINDFEAANALFRNNGNGTFTDIAQAIGLAETGEHCMSISPCDFDLDGDMDIYITNTGVFPNVNNARHMLLVNNGEGVFTESSTLYGLDIFEWGWGSLWVDHDNDGYQDLYIATHRELALPVPNLFYKNNGGTSFTDAMALFHDPQITSIHSVARGDLDRDGYADIVVQNQHPFPPFLWKSDGGTTSHIRVSLEGVVSNRMAIGSWIKVYAGGQQYIHYTVCGENYLGQSSQHVLFGLNSAAVVDSVIVEYLSGHVDRYYDLPVNAEYSFFEGETIRPAISPEGPLTVCAPASVVLDAGNYAFYTWSNGFTGRFLTVFVSGEYSVTVRNDFGVSATTEPVQVTIGPIPAIVVNEQDPICAGETSGSIALVNLSGVATQSVGWSNGATGAQIQGLGAGVYNYTFLDVNGCSATGVVELLDPDPLFVLVNSVNATAGSNGSISWTIFGGAAPYTVRVDGNVIIGGSIADLGAGVYLVQVSDAQGCLFEENVVILGSTGVGEQQTNDLRIYPNPTRDVLYVGSSERFSTVEVFDAGGRSVLQQGLGAGLASIDVSALAAGPYILELRSAEGEPQRVRFVKAER
ncbi:MAG: FG-GAP-like repeat-containing protein, partial [Flavobacteriales bacterium]